MFIFWLDVGHLDLSEVDSERPFHTVFCIRCLMDSIVVFDVVRLMTYDS